MNSHDPTARDSGSEERIERLLETCLEEAEAHLERQVEELCVRHPDRAGTIRDEIEAARSAGLRRDLPPGTAREVAAAADRSVERIGPYQPLRELGSLSARRVSAAGRLAQRPYG